MRPVLVFLPFSMCAVTTMFLMLPVAALVIDGTGNGGMIALVITSVVGFLTMIAQQYFATQKATREHQWDVDERKRQAEETRADLAARAAQLQNQTIEAANRLSKQTDVNTETLRSQLDRSAAVLQDKTEDHVGNLARKLDKAAEAAHDAFGEANKANQKIRDLQETNRQLLLRMEKLDKPEHD